MSDAVHKPVMTYDRTSYVLIVDDDDTLLKFFKIHLNKFFSRVLVVPNAKEALETLRTKEIDLVLTDVRMPRTDGFQLLKKIRAHSAAVPVILISAFLTDEQIAEARELADGFLKKPFGVDELHDLIQGGFRRREILKQLAPMFGDNKDLLKALTGKSKPEKLVKPEFKKAVGPLFDQLEKAGLAKAS